MIVPQGAIKLPSMLSDDASVSGIIYETIKMNLENLFISLFFFFSFFFFYQFIYLLKMMVLDFIMFSQLD